MNLALEKGERVAMGGRGKIRGEAGEVTGVSANVPTTNGQGKRNVVFSGWAMANGKVEELQMVCRFDVD